MYIHRKPFFRVFRNMRLAKYGKADKMITATVLKVVAYALSVVILWLLICVVLRLAAPKSRRKYHGGPLDVDAFRRKFEEANAALAKGNTEGLKEGIGLLIESLAVAGEFAEQIGPALQALYCALSHHDRADTKGPWNRDLSGYGLYSWQNDLDDRDAALQTAWFYIKPVYDELARRQEE